MQVQIVDDLLDLTGDPSLMGKEANVDLTQGKGVAAAVGSKTNGNGHGVAALIEAESPVEGDPIVAIKKRLIAGGAVEEGRKMARVLASQAEAALTNFESSPAKDELISLINLVVERDH